MNDVRRCVSNTFEKIYRIQQKNKPNIQKNKTKQKRKSNIIMSVIGIQTETVLNIGVDSYLGKRNACDDVDGEDGVLKLIGRADYKNSREAVLLIYCLSVAFRTVCFSQYNYAPHIRYFSDQTQFLVL
jgi:hypothetical protein